MISLTFAKIEKFEIGAVRKSANLVELEKFNAEKCIFGCKNRLRYSCKRALYSWLRSQLSVVLVPLIWHPADGHHLVRLLVVRGGGEGDPAAHDGLLTAVRFDRALIEVVVLGCK